MKLLRSTSVTLGLDPRATGTAAQTSEAITGRAAARPVLGSSPRMTAVCETLPNLSPVPNPAVHSARPCPAEGRCPVPAPVVVDTGSAPAPAVPVTHRQGRPPSRGAVRISPPAVRPAVRRRTVRASPSPSLSGTERRPESGTDGDKSPRRVPVRCRFRTAPLAPAGRPPPSASAGELEPTQTPAPRTGAARRTCV